MTRPPLERIHGWLYLLLVLPLLVQAADLLPSWNDSPSKRAITTFVSEVTREGGNDFVPPAERIAMFDNDGTLWSEQPLYIQLAFAMDEVRRLSPQHPEWKEQQPFKTVLENDLETLFDSGMPGLLKVVNATHFRLTTDAQRETAYDRQSSIGRPDKALDVAKADGWTVVDMAREWSRVFPFTPATKTQ